MRLRKVATRLPTAVSIVVVLGADEYQVRANCFFKTRSFSVHFWIVGIATVVLGCVIWLLVVLDHPFLGQVFFGAERIEQPYCILDGGRPFLFLWCLSLARGSIPR